MEHGPILKKNLWINIFHYLPHIHDRTSLEILPHWSHEKGFSPVWTLWCLIRLFCMEKLFITLITCEWLLPSVYSLMIYKSSSFRINLSTLPHGNGFSPVCTLCCLIRLSCMEKTLITLITCEWLLPSVYPLVLE